MYVLGIGQTHNSTAALLHDGRIVAVASEERFSRRKNTTAFPRSAIAYVLQAAGIGAQSLDLVVHSYRHATPSFAATTTPAGALHRLILASSVRAVGNRLTMVNPALETIMGGAYRALNNTLIGPASARHFKTLCAEYLGLSRDRIVLMDHHTAHAYTGYFGFAPPGDPADDVVVLTADAEGDNLCASVSLGRGTHLRRTRVTRARHSLAMLYATVTDYLGMAVNEHEYKVMGLAPYAHGAAVDRAYAVLKPLIWVTSDLTFDSTIGSGAFAVYLRRHLRGHRFDAVAGAVQRLTEELLAQWAVQALAAYDSRRVVLSGGIFMNVKANMVIAASPLVDAVYPCPSAGDESTPIGAAYYGYRLLSHRGQRPFLPAPVETLYLGPRFDDRAIEHALAEVRAAGLCVRKMAAIEPEVARLLAAGAVVARFKDRMEFGARALGNRSILADPRNADSVRVLNQQIKNRDFWMPFAATVLSDRQHDYLRNPKNLPAPHMMLAFDTTARGRAELRAAIHPHDFTVRPQILSQHDNPDYYSLVREFERLTGTGAVLNTSFNLHGEPIVCSPSDALSTLLRSGLRHLALGPYLVSKATPA